MYGRFIKSIATVYLILIMIFLTYLHIKIEDQLSKYSYSLPLIFILLAKIILSFFAYYDWAINSFYSAGSLYSQFVRKHLDSNYRKNRLGTDSNEKHVTFTDSTITRKNNVKGTNNLD